MEVQEGKVQESEVQKVETQEIEVTEDKDYVVYINIEGETTNTANETVVESHKNGENTISQNAVSENAVSENNIILEENGTEDVEEENSGVCHKVDVTDAAAKVQESIEKAEEMLTEDGAELVKDEETIIYTADLTQNEIQQLQESDAAIVVEENIELFGAGHKGKSQEKSKKSKEKSASQEKKKEKTQKKGKTENMEPEWNIQMVNGDVATKVSGETVKVAVMDSGVELLSEIPIEQIYNFVATEQDLPYYMNDMTGHGTAIAGIIHDIAPNAEIYSVRIMDSDNKATLSRVVEGIYWCIDNDIDIINMSFGTTVESAVLEKAIQDANEAGILMVSSAGNGDTAGVEYPAAYEDVIAVGSVDTSAKKTEESAVGEEVELVAPGEQILSDSMLGLETAVSGTSMAAPHVTAAAAVLWQKDKTKSPDFVRGLLSQAANNLGDSNQYGNGLVDLEYALEHYEEYEAAYEDLEAEEVLQTQEAGSNVNLEVNAEAKSEEVTKEQFIEENTTSVELFEEVNYVEGRWEGKGHQELVGYANDNLGDIQLNETQLKIFKEGAVYPDAHFGNITYNEGDKCWHGGAGGNYIANYIFATQMAYHGGKQNKYTQIKGHKKTKFNQMSAKVTTKGVMNKEGGITTWNKLFTSMGLKYKDLSDKNKEKRRKVFLYGLASHTITDPFAHSAYVKTQYGYQRIKHNIANANDVIGADEPAVCPNRFVDAQKAMNRVLRHLQNGTMGEEIDFSPKKKDWGTDRGYYLRNVISHAKTCQTLWLTDRVKMKGL